VKQGDSKASLFRKFGVPEGIIRGWMKEKGKVLESISEVMN
jgi:hypothetical protein